MKAKSELHMKTNSNNNTKCGVSLPMSLKNAVTWKRGCLI